jgi:hypothetical protein
MKIRYSPSFIFYFIVIKLNNHHFCGTLINLKDILIKIIP